MALIKCLMDKCKDIMNTKLKSTLTKIDEQELHIDLQDFFAYKGQTNYANYVDIFVDEEV